MLVRPARLPIPAALAERCLQIVLGRSSAAVVTLTAQPGQWLLTDAQGASEIVLDADLTRTPSEIADGDHAAPRDLTGPDRLRRRPGKFAPFGVHPVPPGVLLLDRLEGPDPDVEGDESPADAPACQGFKDCFGEVQAGGGGGHGTGSAGEDGLVALAVVRPFVALVDVGR